ncbi:MAG: signal peptide peptidase SppA [Coriobacteriaceae bacterium]|nr:signal peptide peptidase SppA [Coriobacteriaceae bacterium]
MEDRPPLPPEIPPQPAGAPSYAPYAAPPPERGRGWIWALIIVLGIMGTIGACSWGMYAAISQDSLPVGDAVAVIHLDGTIAGTGSTLDGVSTPERLLRELREAEDDSAVKAVLIRIDSPGGTVAASEEIATTVARMDKPVVASIGDVGASGAYMIASQCDEIVANPTSSVGSIGVIMQIPNMAKLMEKIGVDFIVLTRGELKDAGSPWRSVTASEMAYFDEGMDVAYDRFIDLVAKGRKMQPAKVRTLASGRIWMASEAKGLGLVDTLGTYDDAMAAAAKRGGIDGDPRVVTYEETQFEDLLSSAIGLASRLGGLGAVADSNGPALPQ